jgi:predicted dithiol-disulfide oxidoreductase (DUF899 family)
MSSESIPHPEIAGRDAWLQQRLELLQEEKAARKHMDAVSARRRRLPMVRVEKSYRFEGPQGEVGLVELFDGCRQLIVYHFMFDPAWDRGCTGCTWFVDQLGDLSMLAGRDANFVLISLAPLEKLETFSAQKGWVRPWYSSFGSEFNEDFGVTLFPKDGVVEYNYRPVEGLEGEEHGLSVFFRIGREVYHTYSAYARGTEGLTDAYNMLDVTPYGRQEDWEDSPSGWPQKPTYG